MKYLNLLIAAGSIALGFSTMAAPVDWSKLPAASQTEGVTFAKDIQPLFKASCVQCHNEKRAKAQLNLTTLEGVMKGTKQGSIVTAGDSANSLLVKAISQLDPETAMPPKGHGRRGPGGPGSSSGGDFGRPPGGDMQPRDGGLGGLGGDDHGPGDHPPGGLQGTNALGQPRRNFTPPKPLTAEQVGLVRAWIDQGAK